VVNHYAKMLYSNQHSSIMIDSRKLRVSVINLRFLGLKSHNTLDLAGGKKQQEMATSGYDTEKNNYPIELLNEDFDRMISTDKEFNDAINDLKAALEKEYFEKKTSSQKEADKKNK
jgi:hypothetical protein